MRLKGHLAAALPLAAGTYFMTRSALTAAAAGAASVLVDLDHLLDYAWLTKDRFRLRDFFSDYGRHRITKLVLSLHSWELSWLALLLTWQGALPFWAWGLVCGWIFHLVCDQIANRVGLPFYFLYYRFSKGFERSRLPCPQGERQP